MLIHLKKLENGEHHFHFQPENSGMVTQLMEGLKKEGFELTKPLDIQLALTKVDEDFYLKGILTTAILQTCARCVEKFSMDVKSNFSIGLTFKQAQSFQDDENCDIYILSEPELDTSPILREQFVLGLPYQALCSENCKGICQKCGKNLNLSPCECELDSFSNPFAVLEKLKKEKKIKKVR